MINDRMDVNEWLRKQLESADPDLLREMVRSFSERLMSVDADEVCGASYGTVSPDRVNSRNVYRTRHWDTRVGTIDLRIPKLWEGTYLPDWLLDARTTRSRYRSFLGCRRRLNTEHLSPVENCAVPRNLNS